MDLMRNSVSPIPSPRSPVFGTHQHSHLPESNFPIIAVAIIGILATAFLLVSYYIFVIKCCLNWHRISLLRLFSRSRSRPRRNGEPLMVDSTVLLTRGLDDSVIRSIPLFQYRKAEKKGDFGGRSFCECAVCLNEFQEDEKLRIIPNCSHVFHIDCIDIWLQNNANCPLCRTSISRFQSEQIIAPTTSPMNPSPPSGSSMIGGDEDFVVIELGSFGNAQERVLPKRRHRSRGDECIDIVRDKDDQFAIQQPIRRSFSMDSSADRLLYLSIRDIARQNSSRQTSEAKTPIDEGCSSSSRGRLACFSFGHGSRGSRIAAVMPVHLDP